ncbi:MAG: hypothetical protein AB7G13_28645 [Lautropia sp.]
MSGPATMTDVLMAIVLLLGPTLVMLLAWWLIERSHNRDARRRRFDASVRRDEVRRRAKEWL